MQGQISFGKSQISLRDPQREEMKAVHWIFVGKLQEGSKVSRAGGLKLTFPQIYPNRTDRRGYNHKNKMMLRE
ncbi:hypothetical protein AFK74_08740 [Bacillus amyloliquefaciens]|nr:hypothetical protein AFK74_08740 [Bacillus amyloliquefaciens]